MATWSYFKAAYTDPGKMPTADEIDIDKENELIVKRINNYRKTFGRGGIMKKEQVIAHKFDYDQLDNEQ